MIELSNSIVQEIASELNETNKGPLIQIAKIIRLCGENFTRDILAQTMQVQAQGGLWLPDNSRQRTIGGVFFHLARQQISPEARREIFPTYIERKRQSVTYRRKQAALAAAMPDDVFQTYQELKVIAAEHHRKITQGKIPSSDLEATKQFIGNVHRQMTAIEHEYDSVLRPDQGKKPRT